MKSLDKIIICVGQLGIFIHSCKDMGTLLVDRIVCQSSHRLEKHCHRPEAFYQILTCLI